MQDLIEHVEKLFLEYEEKRNKKRFRFFRTAAKAHGLITFIVLIVYLLAGFLGDPYFLLSDIKDKYAWATSINVSTYVLGIPDKPEVTAQALCEDGNPYVQLNWLVTAGTITYDVLRDGDPLVTGITAISYRDDVVQKETGYSYVVIANGIDTSVASDSVSVTTGDCYEEPPVQPEPEVAIVSIDGLNLEAYGETPQISESSPNFTGTSNMPDAQIEIELSGNVNVVSTTSASHTGYWSWTVPVALAEGDYAMFVAATDPLDNSRVAESSLDFIVQFEEEEEEEEEEIILTDGHKAKRKKKKTVRISSPAVITPETGATDFEQPELAPDGEVPKNPEEADGKAPFDLRVSVKNKNAIAYIERELDVQVDVGIYEELPDSSWYFQYQIINKNNYAVADFREKMEISRSRIFSKLITLSSSITPGDYKLLVKVIKGGYVLSGETFFTAKEIPLVTFSSGIEFSYQDLIARLGWVLLILLPIFFVWLILFVLESRLAENAIIQVAGQNLSKGGFITKGKGVFQ